VPAPRNCPPPRLPRLPRTPPPLTPPLPPLPPLIPPLPPLIPPLPPLPKLPKLPPLFPPRLPLLPPPKLFCPWPRSAIRHHPRTAHTRPAAVRTQWCLLIFLLGQTVPEHAKAHAGCAGSPLTRAVLPLSV